MGTSHKELDDYIASLGLSYDAQFVPQSKSRNAKEKNPSLNWHIVIGKGGQTIESDYMQGIAHLPARSVWHGLGPRRVVEHQTHEKLGAEEGRWSSYQSASIGEKLPAPLLRDVLYSLVQDASAIDAGSFESWTADYGYDTDSREAERIYKACVDTGPKLRGLIGNAGLEKLQELFRDY